MKLNVNETIEISDEQRVLMANVLDGEVTKRSRNATRDEMKAYCWSKGERWADILVADWSLMFGVEEPVPDDEIVDDLIGEAPERHLFVVEDAAAIIEADVAPEDIVDPSEFI